MKNQINEIFAPKENQVLKFDFWYLMKNAPKFTAPLVKWCGYPFALLCAIGGLVSIFSVCVEYISEGYGLSITRILIALINIGIALLIWVGAGWHGQKQQSLALLNAKFKETYDLNPLQNWKFELYGTKDLMNLISKLSRGNKIIPHLSNIFTNVENSQEWFIGDLVRVEHTSNSNPGYREEISFICLKKPFKITKPKIILTKKTEIEQWVLENDLINISTFSEHIDTLRVNKSGVILEFKNIILDPNKKLALVSIINEQLNNSAPYTNSAIDSKEKQNQSKDMEINLIKLTYHTWEDYLGVFEELIYESGDIQFKFTTNSYELDPQDVVSDVLCLKFTMEKKQNNKLLPLSSSRKIDEWENYMYMATLEQPLSWENSCKKMAHLLVQSYVQHNKNSDTPAEAYYRERISKLGPLSYLNPISYWNDADLNRMQESFVAAENKKHKLIDLLINHKVINFEFRTQENKASFGSIITTTLGNILLEYVPHDTSEPEQVDTIYEITLNIYLRKTGKDELLCSFTNIAEFSYVPTFSTPDDFKTYINLIGQYEFKLLYQLSLNQSKNLDKYLEDYFRSLTN